MRASEWLPTSIMMARGVARGVPGRYHAITEVSKGDHHYVYRPYSRPVFEIDPGDIVQVETKDAFGSKITSEQEKPSKKMVADCGFDRLDAYMLLSQASRVRLGNMVNPKYTIGSSILKKYLIA